TCSGSCPPRASTRTSCSKASGRARSSSALERGRKDRDRLADPLDQLDRVPGIVETVVDRDAHVRRLVDRDVEGRTRGDAVASKLSPGRDRPVEVVDALEWLAASGLHVDQKAEAFDGEHRRRQEAMLDQVVDVLEDRERMKRRLLGPVI